MIDPALIPDGWGWALYHLDPAGPATVELYPDGGGEAVEFSGATALEAWAGVAGFLGVPISLELFMVPVPGEEDVPGPSGSRVEGGQAEVVALPKAVDPFS